jgi:S1 RNA binding domain protein
MSLVVGAIVEGVVTGITHFGAFVLLQNGETGLVHISEVADTYVKDINEHLQKKDRVKVKILSIDGKGKIGLSIKQANSNGRPHHNSKVSRLSFEDKLNKFLKDSDERLQDLRRNTESKRGGRGSPFQAINCHSHNKSTSGCGFYWQFCDRATVLLLHFF